MLKLFSLSIAVNQEKGKPTHITTGYVFAHSKEEALGMALTDARKVFPSPAYTDHSAWVGEIPQEAVMKVWG